MINTALINPGRPIDVHSKSLQSRLLAMWIGINLLDVLVTYQLLGFGGTLTNPYLAYVQAMVGLPMMLAIKLVVGLLVGTAIWKFSRTGLLRVVNPAMGAVVAYSSVVVNYYYLMAALRTWP